MTVKRLADALGRLRADDSVQTNAVGNLAVVRDGRYIGFIDFNTGKLDLYDRHMEARHETPHSRRQAEASKAPKVAPKP